jgi:hypothetical protein
VAIPVYSNGDVPDEDDVNHWFVNNIFKRKPSNESVSSSAVLQDDNDLFFTAEVNILYHVTLVLFVSSQTANDMRIDFNLPAGATFNYIINTQTTTATAYADDTIFPGVAGTAAGIGGIGGVGNAVAHIEGVFIMAGTAGTFQLQWAQLSGGASGTTMIANSFLVARRVG